MGTERVRIIKPKKPSSLLPTESPEQYAQARCKIENAIQPGDAIEEIYCEDVVYERQQMQRLRRWATATLNAVFADAVHAILHTLGEVAQIDDTLLVGQLSNDQAAMAKLSEILAKHGLDVSVIESEAFRQCLLELCAIDRLLTSHGARRDRALQHITVLREIKARRPQLASKSAGGNGSVRRLKQVKNNERAAANS
jgi:hypothetical protein